MLKGFTERPIRFVFDPPEGFPELGKALKLDAIKYDGARVKQSKFINGNVVGGYIFPQDFDVKSYGQQEHPFIFDRKDGPGWALVRLWSEPPPKDDFFLIAEIGCPSQSVTEKDMREALNNLLHEAQKLPEKEIENEVMDMQSNMSMFVQAVNDFTIALQRHDELKDLLPKGKLKISIAKYKRQNSFPAIQALPEKILEVLRNKPILARHYFRVHPSQVGSTCPANRGWLYESEDLDMRGDRDHVLYIRMGRANYQANIQDLHEFATLTQKKVDCFHQHYTIIRAICSQYELELLRLDNSFLGKGSEACVYRVKVLKVVPKRKAREGLYGPVNLVNDDDMSWFSSFEYSESFHTGSCTSPGFLVDFIVLFLPCSQDFHGLILFSESSGFAGLHILVVPSSSWPDVLTMS